MTYQCSKARVQKWFVVSKQDHSLHSEVFWIVAELAQNIFLPAEEGLTHASIQQTLWNLLFSNISW